MIQTRHFLAAAAIAAVAVPAMAATQPPLVIDFESVGDWASGMLVNPDGGLVGSTYQAQGVTFGANAFGLASLHDPLTDTGGIDPNGSANIGSLVPAASGAPGHMVAEIVSGGDTYTSCNPGDTACENQQVVSTVNINYAPKYASISIWYVYQSGTWAPSITLFSQSNGLGSAVGGFALTPQVNNLDKCPSTARGAGGATTNLGPGWNANYCDWKFSEIVLNGQSVQSIQFKTTNSQPLFIDNLTLTPYTVPEPATYALSLLGLAGVGLIARRRAGVKA